MFSLECQPILSSSFVHLTLCRFLNRLGAPRSNIMLIAQPIVQVYVYSRLLLTPIVICYYVTESTEPGAKIGDCAFDCCFQRDCWLA